MPITPARLEFTPEGIPFSAAFDDIYHSKDGGLDQAQHVFMAGNGLPERWRNRRRFTVVETGFGLGLNFLVTWQAWRNDPERSEFLHFASVELFPFSADDLRVLHARLFADSPELAALAGELNAHWPLLMDGFHRLNLDSGKVTLTLMLGDALEQLPQLQASADAFYLDGFAPAKNPQLWQAHLFKQFARLSGPGATLATYTVAGDVRRGLIAAGFLVEKREGFGRKRQMLSGHFRSPRPTPVEPTDRHVIVIGGGIAGISAAERLCSRGWRVTLIESETDLARKASGNHVGAFRPVVSADDNLQARLVRASFLYGLRRLKAIGTAHNMTGALQLARDTEETERFRRIAAQQGWQHDYARWIEQDEASALAGLPLNAGALHFPLAAWIQPPLLVKALANACGNALTLVTGTRTERIQRQGENWLALDAVGQIIASAPVLILANAADATRLRPELKIGADERYVSHLPAGEVTLPKLVVCRKGYLTPSVGGLACMGSSPIDADESIAHAANLGLMQEMLEQQNISTPVAGRRCKRPRTIDRMPVVGQLADVTAFQPKHIGSPHLLKREAGLYAINGFGARGLVWSGLMAELLAAQIEHEPWPIERDLARAIDPSRFMGPDQLS
ncbi:bifunctional tRNA (5-methylaminomethyl-2-thiouridine)(34)-methyltransferase MnmD/FAD-dependent 5-carboxymethylaminomethyl-2-thiouridine(34) oxidoreductase MnmC [Burkholderiaceae bacterium DAT-1]|nr:bifunctional tRNA (5-methylaminomethyl-2-thiouridine)(34)-methyltransferase MnmD/FAD-dependent 5-carboxymethylaminomethyl-2-thiouridine(34) oxidoreductase MnmC [Burkholderiaceae bacterium DAT-1]